MVPHIIFSEAKGYHAGPEIWKSSKASPDAPRRIETTGITQPPVAAEAVVRIGDMLKPQERREWYTEMYPKVLRWHQWLYRERNPGGDGLVPIILSWESGLDDSPPLMEMMHRYAMSNRVKLMKLTGLDKFFERRRKDTREVPAAQRISTLDVQAIYDLIRSLRRKHYNNQEILKSHKFQVIDLAFNCILIRANQHLKAIAGYIEEKLPPDIIHAINAARPALESLWDDEKGYYFNRDAISGKLVRLPSSATFLPLYALDDLPKERVSRLLKHMHDPATFGPRYPVPSAPIDSPYFNPHRYWQGPTWVNINWLLIDGLRRNGRPEEAERLKRLTLEMVTESWLKQGFFEYYSPLDGSVAGARDFSWTAALTIDLLNS